MARKIERVMLFNFPLLSGRGLLASPLRGGGQGGYFDKRRYSSGVFPLASLNTAANLLALS